MGTIVMALCAAGVGIGITVIIAGVWGEGTRKPADSKSRRRAPLVQRVTGQSKWWASAAVLGVVVWLLSGWPVFGMAAAVFAVAVPYLFGGARQARERIERLQAVETWVRRISDLLASGQSSIITAINLASETAPEIIATETTTFARRLRLWDFNDAALAFANDMGDTLTDEVAAGLIVARAQGSGISAVLRELAAKTSREVAARDKLFAEQKKPRSNARIMTMIIVVMMLLTPTLMSASGYMQWYSGFAGQVMLIAVLGMVGGCLVWMRRLATPKSSPRILVGERP